jgi:hypothetical protein
MMTTNATESQVKMMISCLSRIQRELCAVIVKPQGNNCKKELLSQRDYVRAKSVICFVVIDTVTAILHGVLQVADGQAIGVVVSMGSVKAMVVVVVMNGLVVVYQL